MNKIRLNLAASTLLWFWGMLVLLVGFAIGYPALMTQGTPAVLIAFGLWGFASCLAAFALRKRRWAVRWWGSALCILSAAVMLVIQVKISPLGIALNIGAVVLLLLSWNLPGGVRAQQAVAADAAAPRC